LSPSAAVEVLADQRAFGGRQLRLRHSSAVLRCDMTFALFLPPASERAPVPLVTWLSGLTCDDQNFTSKAGFQGAEAQLGVAVLAPDTSPRGEGVPDDPDGAYDLGLGAGFYVDASEAPWREHYRMASYVTEELPALVCGAFPVAADRESVCGHSMGGHGALTLALRRPGRYRSVSAFAPICSPSRCPWGHKALGAYLGHDEARWRQHDAAALIEDGAAFGVPLRVDQGGADDFLAEQLKPELLLAACRQQGVALDYRLHAGYDHSYYFIASFISEHLAFHARALGCESAGTQIG